LKSGRVYAFFLLLRHTYRLRETVARTLKSIRDNIFGEKFARFNNYAYLCIGLYIEYRMKEYKQTEQTAMVSEPIAASLTTSEETVAEKVNVTKGLPQSVDDALADIDEGEREFERKETFSHHEVMQMVWNKINCYAG